MQDYRRHRFLGAHVNFHKKYQCVVRLRVMLWLRAPDVPLIEILTVPTLADLATFRVSVLLVVAGFGLNDAVTPFGKPEADRLTLLLNPFRRVTVMVVFPLPPRAMLKDVGESERLKSGLGPVAIVSETVV